MIIYHKYLSSVVHYFSFTLIIISSVSYMLQRFQLIKIKNNDISRYFVTRYKVIVVVVIIIIVVYIQIKYIVYNNNVFNAIVVVFIDQVKQL